MEILKSTPENIDEIFSVYDAATQYQKTVNNKNWKGFERERVLQEIEEGRHYVILEGDTIACTFLIKDEDRAIWKEKDADPAIYIHRIATNPLFRGGSYVKKIVEWAKEYCKQHQKDYIRIDTMSGNERLNKYYTSCGFTFLGVTDVEWSPELPEHYRNISLSIFEIKL